MKNEKRNYVVVGAFVIAMVVVLLVSGVQLISIGILGEYVGRIYQQTQARPLFIVSEEEEL